MCPALPTKGEGSLPSRAELEHLYRSYRLQYFRKEDDVQTAFWIPSVDEVEIAWSSRLTSSAGICYPGRRIIRLSTHYHHRFPEEVGSTLLHEMIHLVVPGHGPDFYAWIHRIHAMGGKVNRYAKERALPARWEYVCQRCGRRYPRQRRLKGRGHHHRCRVCRMAGGPLLEVGPV